MHNGPDLKPPWPFSAQILLNSLHAIKTFDCPVYSCFRLHQSTLKCWWEMINCRPGELDLTITSIYISKWPPCVEGLFSRTASLGGGGDGGGGSYVLGYEDTAGSF